MTSRYVEIVPTEVGMAGVFGNIHAADGAALAQRLEALAATVCEHDPRTMRQRRADACGPLARGQASLACQCGRDDCAAAAERHATAAAVIHVLAEQATLDGTGDKPGYLPGFGILPAESVRALATSAQAHAGGGAHRRRARSGVSAQRGDAGIPSVARSDVPLAGL